MQSFQRPNTSRAFLATCALVAPIVLTAASARAQTPVPPANPPAAPVAEANLISLDLRDAPLAQAVLALTAKTGNGNIVIQNTPGKPFGTVNIKLSEQPFSRVLQAVAESAGAVLTQRDGIYYLRARTEADTAPPAAAPATPAPATQVVQAPVAAPTRPRVNRQLVKLSLNFLMPSVLVKMLDDPDYLDAYNKHYSSQKFNAGVPDTSPSSSAGPVINVIGNSPTTPAAPATGGVAGSSAGREGGGADTAGARGGQGFPGGFGGGGGRGGGGAFGGGGGQGGPGQGGPGGGQNGQASLRPPGITNIISNDADNALLVEYDEVEDLNRLREIIRLLDVKPKQVQIKAEFVQVTIADADSFGIDWRIQPAGNLDVQIPPESGGSGSPTLLLAYAAGNTVANLRASLIRTTGNVLQAPIISTINNVQGVININDTLTLPSSVTTSTNAGIITTQTFVQFPTFNGLAVTPHINGDNSITLTLRPQLQTQEQQAGGGIRTTTQTAQATRVIQSGETMVLGGFISKQQNRSDNFVPLLSSLPIIGNLFRQRSNTTNGVEILIFVTPTIIEDRSQGVTGTGGGQPAPTP